MQAGLGSRMATSTGSESGPLDKSLRRRSGVAWAFSLPLSDWHHSSVLVFLSALDLFKPRQVILSGQIKNMLSVIKALRSNANIGRSFQVPTIELTIDGVMDSIRRKLDIYHASGSYFDSYVDSYWIHPPIHRQ